MLDERHRIVAAIGTWGRAPAAYAHLACVATLAGLATRMAVPLRLVRSHHRRRRQ